MSSGLRLSGGNDDGNDDDNRSPSGHTIGGQQSSPNTVDNQFTSPAMGQSLLQIDGRRVGDEEIDSDGLGSGDDQIDNNDSIRRKKRYHRHTQLQIQELENSYKNCPHPDDKQRKRLSRDLNLEPLQVKFWFQNKRTQMKMQQERLENRKLRLENESLRAENIRLRDSLGNASCITCGGPTATRDLSFDEHHLRMENVRLKDEIERMSSIAMKRVGNPMPWVPRIGTSAAMELLAPGHVEKQSTAEVAYAAMDELIRMTQTIEPMWLPVHIDGYTTYFLNEDEYFRDFLRAPEPRQPGFRWEATRDSTIVMMNHMNFIGILMNVNQWASLFCGMVAKAIPLELISTGPGGSYDGALQLINAEFQMLSPLVPTRETIMARFCKKHGEGIWAVVDVSLDGLNANQMMKFRKRPSGCLVQQLSNGYSKITWIEHVEVEEKGLNGMYSHLINTGAAFGAKYWLSILNGQCERFACCNSQLEIPPTDVNNIEGRKNMLKLADKMVITFCNKVGASSANSWTTLSRNGHDDVKVMTHKSYNAQGRSSRITISVATSIWLPAAPKRVFDFFRDENNRAKWDILTKSGEILKLGHITTGEQPGNGIILLRVNASPENPHNMVILQESCAYPTGYFIVYTPMDLDTLNKVLEGGDSNDVPLIPSGFVIFPDGTGSCGSLVTLVFQVLVDSASDGKLTISDVATVNSLMTSTLERVRGFLGANPDP